MGEKYRREEPGDLIQVPLFDAAIRGGPSQGQLQHWAKAGGGWFFLSMFY